MIEILGPRARERPTRFATKSPGMLAVKRGMPAAKHLPRLPLKRAVLVERERALRFQMRRDVPVARIRVVRLLMKCAPPIKRALPRARKRVVRPARKAGSSHRVAE